MASFGAGVLMPGLDKDHSTACCGWNTDKGRGCWNWNFLVPNTEPLTGRRLQPYYDWADRPRTDARQTVVNGRLGPYRPERTPENWRTGRLFPLPKRSYGSRRQRLATALLPSPPVRELKTRQTPPEAWKAQALRSRTT